jgi:hypothetical protein
MEAVVLVVMEHGSEWPAHVEQVGNAVETAVLSCSDDAHFRGLEGRVPLAKALVATVLRRQNGRLELVARAKAPDRTKHSLIALAGTLTESLIGTSASVSTRFAEPRCPPSTPAVKRRLTRTMGERRSAASLR